MRKYLKIDRNYKDYLLCLINKKIKSTIDKIDYYSLKDLKKYYSKVVSLHSELLILESIRVDLL